MILAAGAIATPQLLQLSASARRRCCASTASRCSADAARRGREPAGSPADPPGVQGARRAHAQRGGIEPGGAASASGCEYALRRTGPMSMAPSQLGAFVRSDPARPHANLQYHVQPLSLRAYDQPIDRFPAFTASVCNLNPTSRGSVRIRSADIARPAAHRAKLSVDRRGPARGRPIRCASRGASWRSRRWRAYSPAGAPAGRAVHHRRGPGARGRATSRPRSFTRWARRAWARRRCRRGASTATCACAVSARSARGRRQHHADDHQRQYHQPDADDRREGGALDHCRSV